MIRVAIVLALAWLAGCASGPPPPDWQLEARGALESYARAYLQGSDRVAGIEFGHAQRALRATGRADLLARAELTRCALQVASLVFDACPGFEPLRADAGAGERAYAAFLAAQGMPEDMAALLPGVYRGLHGADAAALAAIADPRSRLIAAGVLLRAERITPAGITLAVDTASAQGWRRPLLAWLGLQAARARAAGDRMALEQIERRIARIAPAAH